MKFLIIFLLILVLIINKKRENFNNISNNLYFKCRKYLGDDNPICYNYLINNTPYNPLKRNILRNKILGIYPNKINDNKYNYIKPSILNDAALLIIEPIFLGSVTSSRATNRISSSLCKS